MTKLVYIHVQASNCFSFIEPGSVSY